MGRGADNFASEKGALRGARLEPSGSEPESGLRQALKRSGLMALASFVFPPLLPVAAGYLGYKCFQHWRSGSLFSGQNPNQPGRSKTPRTVMNKSLALGAVAAAPAALLGAPVLAAAAAGASVYAASRALQAWRGANRQKAEAPASIPAPQTETPAPDPAPAPEPVQAPEPAPALAPSTEPAEEMPRDRASEAAWNAIRRLGIEAGEARKLASIGALGVSPRLAAMMAELADQESSQASYQALPDHYSGQSETRIEPVLEREPEVQDETGQESRPEASEEGKVVDLTGYCRQITKSGRRCQRKAIGQSGYCNQHQALRDRGQTGSEAGSTDSLALAGDLAAREQITTARGLQRKLGCSFHDAVDLIRDLEGLGVVSAPDESGTREVLMSPAQVKALDKAGERAAEIRASGEDPGQASVSPDSSPQPQPAAAPATSQSEEEYIQAQNAARREKEKGDPRFQKAARAAAQKAKRDGKEVARLTSSIGVTGKNSFPDSVRQKVIMETGRDIHQADAVLDGEFPADFNIYSGETNLRRARAGDRVIIRNNDNGQALGHVQVEEVINIDLEPNDYMDPAVLERKFEPMWNEVKERMPAWYPKEEFLGYMVSQVQQNPKRTKASMTVFGKSFRFPEPMKASGQGGFASLQGPAEKQQALIDAVYRNEYREASSNGSK